MKNKTAIITFIISFIVVGTLIAVLTWNQKPGSQNRDASSGDTTTQTPPSAKGDDTGDEGGGAPSVLPGEGHIPPSVPSMDVSKIQAGSRQLADAVVGLMTELREEDIELLVGHNVIDRDTVMKLKEAVEARKLVLDANAPLVEIGSWDAGNMVRYRVNFEDGRSGVLDMQKGEDNLWRVHSLTLPESVDTGDVAVNDAMGVAEQFVKSVLRSDFETACSLIDSEKISNATIAGLCILFEEGNYELRANNAIKGMFNSPENAGFLCYLEGRNGAPANMGMTMKKTSASGWHVAEISLDSLLSSYVKEIADGEETFVPLVKNPKGGDSLVLFFGFDDATLTPRSLKQLEIVAKLVTLSEDKKLEITGHTDDLGGETYNQKLSERRALAVRDALIANGVPSDRIVTQGFGKKQPRRTYGSEDTEIKKDEARRVNRRAEMYLDF